MGDDSYYTANSYVGRVVEVFAHWEIGNIYSFKGAERPELRGYIHDNACYWWFDANHFEDALDGDQYTLF